jgi:hypothetical protein
MAEPLKECEVVSFRDDGVQLDVTVSPKEDTVWLSQDQMGILFGRSQSVIARHIRNIFSEGRVLVTDDNYVCLVHRVNSLENRIQGLEEKAGKDAPFRLFYQGEWFEPYAVISEIVQSAKNEIVLIDAYADAKALTFFVEKQKEVRLRLYCSSQAKLTSECVERFNRSYGGLSVSINDAFHDRFLIIDRADGYLIGSSLNYAGKKAFGFYRLEDRKIIVSILALLKEGPE